MKTLRTFWKALVSLDAHCLPTKIVRSKRGERMLMLNLSDHSGMMDTVVWPEQYQKYHSQLSTAEALRITGKAAESFGVATLEASVIEKVEFG